MLAMKMLLSLGIVVGRDCKHNNNKTKYDGQ